MATKYEEKMWEARYFVEGMRAELERLNKRKDNDFRPLTANLRACVTAARTMLLYAEEDVFAKANGRPAKRGKLGKDAAVKKLRDMHKKEPVLDFFHNLRNLDVHVKPSGELKKEQHTLRATAIAPGGETSAPLVFTVYTLTLSEWPAKGPDVFTLCEQYLQEVDKLLADAEAAKLLRR